ncbi:MULTISPECIES: hypothetical protein [Microcoleaceae]|uniref:hypothetical protein n=1 Tax=Microcoleaceae TaxID=1892252 RepID=UPI0018800181|nr:hypothetical protein [Tychonema sp. LEGE 06208]MBE9160733.1 hypothetical protein [Tychonema sp. LEGE 06208]
MLIRQSCRRAPTQPTPTCNPPRPRLIAASATSERTARSPVARQGTINAIVLNAYI